MAYTFMDFIQWAYNLSRGSFGCQNILFREGVRNDGKKFMEIEFFTNKNRYVITTVETEDGRPLYLDSQLITRAPYPGERHVRYADVSDGKLTPETWAHILSQIIHYEMLPIAKDRYPTQIVEKDKLTLVDALDKYFPGWNPFEKSNPKDENISMRCLLKQKTILERGTRSVSVDNKSPLTGACVIS